MGYMLHHAIVVTSWDDHSIELAHKKAVEFFGSAVSGVTESQINNYRSFLIAPDGSKEGWEDSRVGDMSREAFKIWMRQESGVDFFANWCEVMFGGDSGEAELLDHCRAEAPE